MSLKYLGVIYLCIFFELDNSQILPHMPIIQENNPHSRHHGRTQNNPQQPPAPPPRRHPHHNPKPNTNSCPRKLLFLFLKWMIMTFVLSLFLIFLGFAALVLLHVFLTTTAAHRHLYHRRLTRRSPNYSTNSTSKYSMQDLHDLLPHLQYSASAQTTRDCAICLEGFKEGELCRKLPDCTHLFHENCVDNWLIKVATCPICRTRVQLGASGSRISDVDLRFWWPAGT